MNNHLRLLGFQVRDVVTKFTGVATTIASDLYGCVQAFVSPGVDKAGGLGDGHWFDTKRLELISKKPVMSVPTFDVLPGGQRLPAPPSQPTA